MNRHYIRPEVRAQAGFSLLEVMIALALGLLLSAGIIALFSNTSQTNKVQDGLARLQENGRFAVMRIEQDFRMLSAQYCSNTTGASAAGTAVPVMPTRAPMVFAADINLPDSDIHSIATNGTASMSPASAAYQLSPRWFMQGYSCTAGACTPALPTGVGQIPAMGLAVGNRVPGSDVLTVRYQRGTGWPLAVGACGIGAGGPLTAGTAITLSPQTGDDPVSGMTPGLALITDCTSPSVVPISSVSGSVMTVGSILPSATGRICSGNSTRDVRAFNFTTDFVTVSYYLAFRQDDSPDARPNSALGRLIPVLVRRENGNEQELVRGVDQLSFRFGVMNNLGQTQFLTAQQVESAGNCPPPPPGLNIEPGCMWRAVRTIEAHLLVNTVDEVFGLDNASRTYRFNGGAPVLAADATTLPSGILAGSQLRREFIAYVSGRNHNL